MLSGIENLLPRKSVRAHCLVMLEFMHAVTQIHNYLLALTSSSAVRVSFCLQPLRCCGIWCILKFCIDRVYFCEDRGIC